MFRLAELLSPLAAAADLGAGLPPETGARTALIGLRLAERLGLDAALASDGYYAALLRQRVPEIFGARCEVAGQLARRLGLGDVVVRALDETYERFDG